MRRRDQQSKRYRAISRGRLTPETWDAYKKGRHS